MNSDKGGSQCMLSDALHTCTLPKGLFCQEWAVDYGITGREGMPTSPSSHSPTYSTYFTCAHTCIHMHAHVYTCMHMYAQLHVHTMTHVYLYNYVKPGTYVRMYVCTVRYVYTQ